MADVPTAVREGKAGGRVRYRQINARRGVAEKTIAVERVDLSPLYPSLFIIEFCDDRQQSHSQNARPSLAHELRDGC